MKTHDILIQNNTFNGAGVATTQEDNFGGILNRFDLFHRFHNENNGNETMSRVGHLVEYMDGNFAVFHGSIRYDLPKRDVVVNRVPDPFPVS